MQQNREQFRQVLIGNPQLVYSLLQAQLVLGLVSPQTVQVLINLYFNQRKLKLNYCSEIS